jgi:hypothetical protein
MSNNLFSKSTIDAVKSIHYRVKFNETLTSILDLAKAEQMISYLTKAGMGTDLWEMRAAIIAIELMNENIYDDDSALSFINSLGVPVN